MLLLQHFCDVSHNWAVEYFDTWFLCNQHDKDNRKARIVSRDRMVLILSMVFNVTIADLWVKNCLLLTHSLYLRTVTSHTHAIFLGLYPVHVRRNWCLNWPGISIGVQRVRLVLRIAGLSLVWHELQRRYGSRNQSELAWWALLLLLRLCSLRTLCTRLDER